MATYTKIIEFAGLPASGKSTLCNFTKGQFQSQGLSVAVWTDITKDYKELSIIRKIKRFPYALFPLYLILFVFLPSSPAKMFVYWFSIKISIVYRGIKKSRKYDYILNEHGAVQNVLSLLQGSKPINGLRKQIYNYLLQRLLEKELVDKYIICMVDKGIAIERMLKRNRTSEGRLDKIKDENILLDLFEKEQNNLNSLLPRVPVRRSEELDMQQNVMSLYSSLVTKIL